jgi:hypothetical protein
VSAHPEIAGFLEMPACLDHRTLRSLRAIESMLAREVGEAPRATEV